ncbi:MAG: hypothetical protein K9G44_11850 [Melioribacteraceae bacterium]|nr:hypothetical protein [Melioribacteraceae bacterium]
MKSIKKIFYFFFAFALVFVVKEFFELYYYIKEVNIFFGYAFLLAIVLFVFYFLILPLYRLIRLPRNYKPAKDESEKTQVLTARMKQYSQNPKVLEMLDDKNFIPTEENYYRITNLLKERNRKIRKHYVNQVFYSTAISQNGFLDALFVLSASIDLIKDTFILFNGRTSNRDLFIIFKKVYYSMLVGGSEGIEYATEEIFSKFATDTMKSIPILNKILSSLADGFVNATLLTRISLITENYCTVLVAESDKDLRPNPGFILEATKDLTSELFEQINTKLKALAKEKSKDTFQKTVNPVLLVLDKGYMGIKDSKSVNFGKSVFRDGVEKFRKIVGKE